MGSKMLFHIVLIGLTQFVLGSKVFPNLGLVIENHGVAVHAFDYKYVSVAVGVKMDDFLNVPDSNCNTKHIQKLKAERKRLIDNFWSLVPYTLSDYLYTTCHHQGEYCGVPTVSSSDDVKSRGKRGLLSGFAGLFGVGVSLFNLYETAKIQKAVSDIKGNEKELVKFVNSEFAEMSDHIKIHDALFFRGISLIGKDLSRLEKRMCAEFTTILADIEILNSRAEMNRFSDKILSAMGGQVSPYLIPAGEMMRSVLKDLGETEEVYSSNPGLFYAISTSVLIGVDRNNSLLHFLVKVPIISNKDISPLYKIYNYGSVRNGTLIRTKLPDQFFVMSLPEETVPLKTDLTRCKVNEGIWLCSYQNSFISQEEQCLAEVWGNLELSSCGHDFKEFKGGKLIHTLPDGVITRGYPQYEVMKDYTSSLTGVRKVDLELSEFTFIQVKYGEKIKIGQRVIKPSMSLNTTFHFDSMIDNETISFISENLHLLSTEWQSEASLIIQRDTLSPYRAFEMKTGFHSSGYSVIWLLILTVLVLGTLVVIGYRVFHLRQKKLKDKLLIQQRNAQIQSLISSEPRFISRRI